MLTSGAGWWIGYCGESASFTQLQQLWPDLELRTEGGNVLLGGRPLQKIDEPTLCEGVARFTDCANTLLAISNSNAGTIRQQGSLYRIDENGRHYSILLEAGSCAVVGYPIALSARGSTIREQPRPMGDRVAELCSRSEPFLKAGALLAHAGDDLRELHKVMEVIEKAHGGWSKKDKTGRAAFCTALQVNEAEWDGLHRTARPTRHAYPHDMNGPTYAPPQVRVALQH